MASNEGKACDAVGRFIEQRTGDGRTDIRWPERDHVGPPVELRLKIGSVEYAIEHTRIEPFENEIGDGVSLSHLFDPVKKALSGDLFGPADYLVVFPSNRNLIAKKPTLKQQQKNLEAWVREKTLSLYGKVQENLRSGRDRQPGGPVRMSVQSPKISYHCRTRSMTHPRPLVLGLGLSATPEPSAAQIVTECETIIA